MDESNRVTSNINIVLMCFFRNKEKKTFTDRKIILLNTKISSKSQVLLSYKHLNKKIDSKFKIQRVREKVPVSVYVY